MAVKCKQNNLKSTIPLVPNCADFWNCTELYYIGIFLLLAEANSSTTSSKDKFSVKSLSIARIDKPDRFFIERVDLKRFFIRFNAENERSLEQFVIGIDSIILNAVSTLGKVCPIPNDLIIFNFSRVFKSLETKLLNCKIHS